MRKAIIHSAAVVPLLLALISCTAMKKEALNLYTDTAYNQGSIQKIAVFPIRDARFAPSVSREIENKIITSIQSRHPEISIIPPSDSTKKIDESGLAGAWKNFVDYYYFAGIIHNETLHDVSNSLGVDAVMLGRLMSVYQKDGNGWNTTGTTIVTVILSVLEDKSATTIWEVSADEIVKREVEVEAPAVSEVVDLVIDKVILNGPRL